MRAPRWEDIISETFDAKMEDVHTSEPGWVLSYDPASKTCTAQASMAQAYIDENGDRKLSNKPPCRAARAKFPGNVAFNLEPGDPVLIHYCSTALDNYSPGRARTADPGDDRRHNLSDAFVTPIGRTNEVPAKGEYIVEYDKVSLGKPGLGETRQQVVRKIDAQAGKTSIDAVVDATQIALDAALLGLPGTAALVAELQAKLAALTPVASAFAAMVSSISSNVEAT